jgi:hypothetical protein
MKKRSCVACQQSLDTARKTYLEIPLIKRLTRKSRPLPNLAHRRRRTLLHRSTQEQERFHRIWHPGGEDTPAEWRRGVRTTEDLREEGTEECREV